MRLRLAVCAALLCACGGGGAAPILFSALQVASVTETSAIVAWRTAAPVLGAVEYGPTPMLGSRVAGSSPATEHVFRLENLPAGVECHYRVFLDGAAASDTFVFRTFPAGPAPLRFVVLGDSGGSAVIATARPALLAQIAAAAPEFLLHVGDVAYLDGTEEDLHRGYFEPMRDLLPRVPVFFALGNHDVDTEDGRPTLDALYLPGDERNYSFDRGDVHVVALDSNHDLPLGWLEADLAATSARWIFVYMHHPPYSSSRHGSDTEIRGQLAPLCDRYGVDVVFSGHDHNYERTFPLLADAVVDAGQDPDFADPSGTIYVVTGGGGFGLYPSGTSVFTAESESVYHFVRVEIDGNRLDLTALGGSGQVYGRMSITKTP